MQKARLFIFVTSIHIVRYAFKQESSLKYYKEHKENWKVSYSSDIITLSKSKCGLNVKKSQNRLNRK